MSYVISVVGAGGKTTLINRMRNQHINDGKRVLVTTTTHMFRTEDTDISCNKDSICDKIRISNYCIAGVLDADNPCKITSLPDNMLDGIWDYADVMLIEADGAKHYSVKFPREDEPVIYEKTDEIIIVMGLWDIGRLISDSVFRYEVLSDGNIIKNNLLSISFIENVLIAEYERKIKENNFQGKVTVLFSDKIDGELVFYSPKEAHRIYGQ